MLTTVKFNNGSQSSELVPLSRCLGGNWNETAQISAEFVNLGGSNWLCPDPEYETSVGGRWSANYERVLTIMLAKCGSVYPNKTNCASDAQLS